MTMGIKSVKMSHRGKSVCIAILLISLTALFVTVQSASCKDGKRTIGEGNQKVSKTNPHLAFQDTILSLIKKLRDGRDRASQFAITEQIRQLLHRQHKVVRKGDPVSQKGNKILKNFKGNSHPKQIATASAEVIEPSVAHHVPLASTKNRIELSIDGSPKGLPLGTKIVPVATPAWIHVGRDARKTQGVGADSTETVYSFDLAVDKEAPINRKSDLSFALTSPTGGSWVKKITIVVDPPDRFELFQNFPNPFNPTTTISYLLPKQCVVTLKVYNMLGQEVATLVNELQEAGYRTATLDGRNLASGVYVYRIQAHNFSDVKKMILLK